MENLLIEKFCISDLNEISSCLEKDFDDFWNINILKKELNNPDCIYLCCKLDSEIVGFAGITIVLDTAELNNIVIKKSKRGQGLSLLLLKKLIEEAKINNCIKVNLEVSRENKIAINLYEKVGFKQVGLRSKYYNGTDALLYTLDI